jgi:hypothetical protein
MVIETRSLLVPDRRTNRVQREETVDVPTNDNGLIKDTVADNVLMNHTFKNSVLINDNKFRIRTAYGGER